MLAPVLDPFDGALEAQRRDEDEDVFGIDFAADAEAAADMAFEQVDGGRAAAENLREHLAVLVRHLGGAVQFEHVARRVVAADRAARFERHAGMASDLQRQFDDREGLRERGVDVAVALRDERRFRREPRGELGRRRLGREDRRQLREIEKRRGRRHPRRRNRPSRTPRPRARRHSGRRRGRGRAVDRARACRSFPRGNSIGPQAGNVGCRPDGIHAGQGKGGGDVDPAQLRMRHRRTHDAHVQLVRKVHVRRKFGAARQQRGILEARHGAADDVEGAAHRAAFIRVAASMTAARMFS